MFNYLINEMHPMIFALITGAICGFAIFFAMFKGNKPGREKRFLPLNILGWILCIPSMVLFLVIGVIIPYLGEVGGVNTGALLIYAILICLIPLALQNLTRPREKNRMKRGVWVRPFKKPEEVKAEDAEETEAEMVEEATEEAAEEKTEE